MGKPNIITKRYMQDSARFADICNFFLYNGQQIIKPDDLVERDVTELALPKGHESAEAVEKIRDILKGCCVKTANGVTYLIIGIENQNDTHYAMVVRNMLYDALNYSSQVGAVAKQHRKKKDVTGAEFLSGFAKEDKLVPVITLTIYWNTGSWDGARSLHELLDVSDRNILNYVSDYKLNLIVPEEIEDFNKFETELGPLLEFINSAASGKKFTNAFETKRTRWESLSNEAIDLLNICLDAKLEIEKDLEKGVGNVCKGLEEFWEMVRAEAEKQGLEEGRLAGLEKGREEGREEGILLTLLQLVRDGLLDLSVGIERSGISEAEFIEKLKQLA
ncbi:MAG: transposase [Lachnospiraceae bacterium]|nr:transposase [Lachnospiraceae bacterium]